MAKSLQRKKPGYTVNGEVKIVSLSHAQLVELLDKTQRNKTKAKIQQRIRALEDRPKFKAPAVPEEVAE